MTDWQLIRMHYEVLGYSVQELAKSHHVSPSLIVAAIKKEQWERHPIVQSVKHWTRATNPDGTLQTEPEILEDVKSKAQIMDLLRNTERSPDLFKAEAMILSKIGEIVASIDASDVTASKQLKNLVECVKNLQPEPIAADKAAGEGFSIKILNHYGDAPLPVGCDDPPIQIPQIMVEH